jgi:hypothetical protein
MRPAGAIGPRRRRTDLGRGPRRRLLPTWEEAQAFIHVAQPDPLILSAFRGDVGGPVLGVGTSSLRRWRAERAELCCRSHLETESPRPGVPLMEIPRNLEDTMLGLLVMVIGIAVMAPIAPRAHAGLLWLIGGAVMTAAMILI